MARDAIGLIIEKINEDIVSFSEDITRGSARDFASYRALAGAIQGLQRALAIVQAVVKEEEDEDE